MSKKVENIILALIYLLVIGAVIYIIKGVYHEPFSRTFTVVAVIIMLMLTLLYFLFYSELGEKMRIFGAVFLAATVIFYVIFGIHELRWWHPAISLGAALSVAVYLVVKA